MVERVAPVPGHWNWEPNAPCAVLISDDSGAAALALRCHPDDGDRRTVVVTWKGAVAASMGGPNDEALFTHRLYNAGLRDLLWLGEVHGSTWLADAIYDRPGYRHFIASLKETVVEVLAKSVTGTRSESPPAAAAVEALAACH